MTVAASDEPAVDPEEVRRFLESLSGAAAAACADVHAPGLLQITRIHPVGDTHSYRFPIGAVEVMVAQAVADARAGYNVYVEGRTVAEDTPRGKRGDHSYTRCVFALVADDDGDKDMATIDCLEPSLIVQSSPGNSHRWFLLKRALPHAEAAQIGVGIKAFMGGDSDTGVPTQPYRVAGTPNYPNAAKRARGRVNVERTSIIAHSGATYDAEELRLAFPAPEKQSTEAGAEYDGPRRDIDELLATCSRHRRDQLAETAVEMRARGTNRSDAFMPVVGFLRGDGFSLAEAVELFRAFPGSGHMQKYADRLDVEVARVWDKVNDRPGSEREADADKSVQQLRIVSAATLAAGPAPARAWHVRGVIPAGTVTSLYGDGGTGKSLLALQLAVATATGREWVGVPVAEGPCIFLTAEDDLEEVHRRLADICRADEVEMASLGALQIIPRAGEDAVLAAPEARSNFIKPTKLFEQLEAAVAKHRPRLIVLDTAADLFAGDEINRAQVRQFIGLLRGLASQHKTTVLLLAHPSVTGMANGSGLSGSTAWNGSVRSRLYLRRSTTKSGDRLVEEDSDIRSLAVVKANYGPVGNEITLRWDCGRFRRERLDTVAATSKQAQSDAIFRELLRTYISEGRNVTANSSPNFAPATFAKDSRAKGLGKNPLNDAMNRLLAAGEIVVEVTGPPSRQRSRLAFASVQQADVP